MNIIQKFLPDYCYSGRKLISCDVLVLHYFSGRWQFPEDRFNMYQCYLLFCDLNLPVEKRKFFKMSECKRPLWASAKYLIGLEGDIWQLIPDGYEQRHAGNSQWTIKGKTLVGLNKYSDGIEIINDGIKPYTNQQYRALDWLIGKKYNKMMLRIEFKDGIYQPANGSQITGHENIAPDRKKDPGRKFNWLKLENLLDAQKQPVE